ICFASGVAGIDAIMKGLDPGDKIVASDDLYGGTFRLFNHVFARYGFEFEYVDMTRLDEVEAALDGDVRLVWLETPSNPMMRIIDLEAVADMARTRNIQTAVDNTFATPYLQQPLSLGIDLVLHSTTKYLGGHSDVIGGVVCTNSDEWAEKLRFQIKSTGAVPGPMDCFLTLRGTKTLHVRMQRHCENAIRMAEYLSGHSKVAAVYFPGLSSHPGHDLARRQMRDFGGMISFTLRSGDVADVSRVLSATRVFSLAESLGGVESLIEHPSTMTHASMTAEQRERAGISDGLIRLSVGIEDYADLEDDLDQALEKAS
ncbi:MAG: PLP-dependent aspartate aminotransferase family protein, partial [Rhodothermia bacterium]|nr:PLP-dependent aspartate aminotransferase family protein [Rhodothermia bacterium]